LVLPDCWIVTWSVTAILSDTCAPSVERDLMIHSIWRDTLEHTQVFGRINVIFARNHSPSGVLWKVTVLKYMVLLIVTSTNSADQRCMYARTVGTPLRSPRCITSTWRSSTPTPPPSSNSTTRGISSSTAPTLRRICCRGDCRLYMRVLIGVFLSSVIFPIAAMSAVFPLLILIYSTLCIITIISIDDLNSFHNLYKYLSRPHVTAITRTMMWSCNARVLLLTLVLTSLWFLHMALYYPHYCTETHWHSVIVTQWRAISWITLHVIDFIRVNTVMSNEFESFKSKCSLLIQDTSKDRWWYF